MEVLFFLKLVWELLDKKNSDFVLFYVEIYIVMKKVEEVKEILKVIFI